jgi:hypothetical protein
MNYEWAVMRSVRKLSEQRLTHNFTLVSEEVLGRNSNYQL